MSQTLPGMIVTITKGTTDKGFFVAQAKLYVWSEFGAAIEAGSKTNAMPILRSGLCESRDENSAISYALTELATMVTQARK